MKAPGTPIPNTVSAVDDHTFFNTIPSPTNTHWHPRLGTFDFIHTAHGRALAKTPGACYPLRTRHRIAAVSAGIVDATAQATEYEECKNSDEDVDWAATYGAETVARLKEVKKKFDPTNMFKTG
ncbi:hypothetical protein LY76DRAFT_646201 [Colletotrichum caudatum]|nr:hypothetical protein LY76DRAFT_646201 [Colletotrichum caudatum]